MIATDDEQAPSIRYGEKVALVRQAIEVDLIGHADRQIVVGLDQTEPLRSQPRLYRTTGGWMVYPHSRPRPPLLLPVPECLDPRRRTRPRPEPQTMSSQTWLRDERVLESVTSALPALITRGR
jgi:hypothetical protein